MAIDATLPASRPSLRRRVLRSLKQRLLRPYPLIVGGLLLLYAGECKAMHRPLTLSVPLVLALILDIAVIGAITRRRKARRQRRLQPKLRTALSDDDLSVLETVLGPADLESQAAAQLGMDLAGLREIIGRLEAAGLIRAASILRGRDVLYLACGSTEEQQEWLRAERERRVQALSAPGPAPGLRQRISQLAR